MTGITAIRRTLAAAGDLMMPRVCAACHAAVGPDDETLCGPCAAELAACVGGAYCRRCGESRADYLLHDGVCTYCTLGKSRTRFSTFVRVGVYDGPLKTLILRFKKSFILDQLLGEWLAGAVSAVMNPAEVDCWAPIPAHWRRRIRVGFQPTALLARALAARVGGDVTSALCMTEFIPEFHLQPQLSAVQRAERIRGKMSVRRGFDPSGLHVCLVDDVMTTGATLGEAARALREAGAGRISAAVLARAGRFSTGGVGVDRTAAAI